MESRNKTNPPVLVICKWRWFQASRTPLDKGEREGRRLLQGMPLSCAWKEAFNCLVVKSFWVLTGVEQAVETPRCPGLAVHKCRTIRHLLNAEVLGPAKNPCELQSPSVWHHCISQGVGRLLPVSLRGSPNGSEDWTRPGLMSECYLYVWCSQTRT